MNIGKALCYTGLYNLYYSILTVRSFDKKKGVYDLGYRVITTEKPSVANDIAKVVGANRKHQGYFVGNNFKVVWAVGHLVGLAEPEEYGYMSLSDLWDKEHPENKQKALNELPLIPEEFKLVVLERTKEQFEVMKKLLNADDTDEIIDAGDAGAEGGILQWFIRVKAGCNKPVKRCIVTSMTEEAIRDALNNLKDINDYTSQIKAEFCKKKLDQILGVSISRGASITYDAKVDVGRVQSPTLFFIVQRYLEAKRFISKNYYVLSATMDGNFDVFFMKDTENHFDASNKDVEGRITNETALKEVAEILRNEKGVVSLFDTKSRSTNRPQLYDITELERDGNRIYGYTAEEVLEAAQSLYEKHKITTYPRTDSRYITHDLGPLMLPRINDISMHEKYKTECNKLITQGLNIDSHIVDDEKVTDHHAIVVTEKIRNYDLSVLNDTEANVLDLIITRMIVAFSQKYKYKETTVYIKFQNGIVMSASGRVPIDYGWKRVHDSLLGKEETEQEKNEQIFPVLEVGQKIEVKNIKVVTKKTTPPQLHTEATLLTAMENAGNNIVGGEIIKGRGIGTQATRANIIKSLFTKGYVVNEGKGKTKYLVPTKQGLSVIKILPKELYNPKITVDWENYIADIIAGIATEEEFMDKYITFIKNMLDEIVNNKLENVDFTYTKTVVGLCPWCGNKVYEGKLTDKETNKTYASFYCSKREKCNFSINAKMFPYPQRTGKNLTRNQMKLLVQNGMITSKCVKKDGSGEYQGTFKVSRNEKGYCSLSFDIGKSSSTVKKEKSN